MKRGIFAFLVCAALCITLGGCYDSEEISRISFVMAIGFDTAENGENTYSFQTANPTAYEEGSDDEPVTNVSVTAKTLYAAIDRLNTDISEKIDCSHIKLAVFSEEYLRRGIGKEMNAMFKSSSFHPNTRVAMAKGLASDYLEKTKIPPDTNPAEYYENIFKSDYTSVIPDVRLRDLVNKYDTEAASGVLPIVAPESTFESMAILKNYVLSDIAGFNDVICYDLLTNGKFEFNQYIKYPSEDSYTVVEIKQKHRGINADLSGGKPKIEVDVVLEGSVLWSESPRAYSTEREQFDELLKERISAQITEFLNNCSQKYKADILNISKIMRKNYLTIQSWEREDGQGLFENASYSVNVSLTVKREGINGVEK